MIMGTISGKLDDGKAAVTCKILNAGAAEKGQHIWIEGRALVDTGASDVLIRDHHLTALQLKSDGPALRNECVGVVQQFVPYRTIVVLTGTSTITGGEYTKPFGRVRTFASSFAEDFDFVLGMNVLRMTHMQFRPDGTFEIGLP